MYTVTFWVFFFFIFLKKWTVQNTYKDEKSLKVDAPILDVQVDDSIKSNFSSKLRCNNNRGKHANRLFNSNYTMSIHRPSPLFLFLPIHVQWQTITFFRHKMASNICGAISSRERRRVKTQCDRYVGALKFWGRGDPHKPLKHTHYYGYCYLRPLETW